MKKVAVITARFDGEPHRIMPIENIANHQIEYFYFDDSNISFNKEISAEQREGYLKRNPDKIFGLKNHDIFICVDKSVKVISNSFVSDILTQLQTVPFLCTPEMEVIAGWNMGNILPSQQKIFDENRKHVQPEKIDESSYRVIPYVRPIIGFWHICLIGNWKQVVDEQLNELLQYGLIEACQSIQIGVLGPEDQLNLLLGKIKKHSKLSVKFYHRDITQYEFPTLFLLKEECHVNEFFGFYFHTKGVSYNGHPGGTHWRQYMSYYNLEKWRDCIARLKQGYNLCGVKLMVRPPEKEATPGHWPTHYSGNFFHFRSEYIETCPEISTVNHKNRFESEFWVCSGKNINPISLCDKMIDYNVKGNFVKPVIGRTVVSTMCFNLPSAVEEATKLLYQQNTNYRFEHVLVDLGFPMNKAKEIPEDIEVVKKSNAIQLLKLSKSVGSIYRKMEDLGASQNMKTIIQHMNIGDSDVLIYADSDKLLRNDNWIKAISEVLVHGNKIAWCSLMDKEYLPEFKKYPHKEEYVYGHKIYIIDNFGGWLQGGYSGEFLNLCKLPENVVKGWRYAVMADFEVENIPQPALYREWKIKRMLMHKEDGAGQTSFEDWLKIQLESRK